MISYVGKTNKEQQIKTNIESQGMTHPSCHCIDMHSVNISAILPSLLSILFVM